MSPLWAQSDRERVGGCRWVEHQESAFHLCEPTQLWGHILQSAFWGRKSERRAWGRTRTMLERMRGRKAAAVCPNLENQATLPWQLCIATRQPGVALNIELNSWTMKKKRKKVGRLKKERGCSLQTARRRHCPGLVSLQGIFQMVEGFARDLLSLVWTCWELCVHIVNLCLKKESPKSTWLLTQEFSSQQDYSQNHSLKPNLYITPRRSPESHRALWSPKKAKRDWDHRRLSQATLCLHL